MTGSARSTSYWPDELYWLSRARDAQAKAEVSKLQENRVAMMQTARLFETLARAAKQRQMKAG